MRKAPCIFVALLMTMPAFAANKQKRTCCLKDFHPARNPGKKQKQQFDFIIDTSATECTCRTTPGINVKANDWPVGFEINLEIDNEKRNIKYAKDKKVDCTIMLVGPIKAANTQ